MNQYLGPRGDGRRRHRRRAARLQAEVRNAPTCQSCITIRLPAACTAAVMGRQACTCSSLQMPGTLAPKSLALVTDRGGFADDQAGAGALRVVARHQGVGARRAPGCA